MANPLDSDASKAFSGIAGNLSLLSTDDNLRAGIRVTRAQFARMMGCSRQAVTEWVRAGRLTVGADERFDPTEAVASLLRTGDPAKIRARVLAPLVRDLSTRDREIERLRLQLAQIEAAAALAKSDADSAEEAADFAESACSGFSAVLRRLEEQLPSAWEHLAAAPDCAGANALLAWVDTGVALGADEAGKITDYLPPGAPATAERDGDA